MNAKTRNRISFRLAWVVPQLNASIASTRYRCYYPAAALAAEGFDSRFFNSSSEVLSIIEEFDAIIIVKTIDETSLQLAEEANAKGIGIYLDLCDNIVVSSYPTIYEPRRVAKIVDVFSRMDGITFASPALQDAVDPLLRRGQRTAVIPDQIETRTSVAAAFELQPDQSPKSRTTLFREQLRRALLHARNLPRQPRRYAMYGKRRVSRGVARIADPTTLRGKIIRLTHLGLTQPRLAFDIVNRRTTGRTSPRLLRALADIDAIRQANLLVSSPSIGEADLHAESVAQDEGKSPRKRILWFGNFGAPHSDFGMLALLQAVPALEALSKETGLELVVVSNRPDMFDIFIKPINLSTRYVAWSPEAVFREVESCDVCLLPFGHDPFSLTKSANRAVLALQHGLPVVTSRLKSMLPLEGTVIFEEWERGLRHYLGPDGDRNRVRDLAKARPILEETFSVKAIGHAWASLLRSHDRPLRPGYGDHGKRLEVGLLIGLSQDLDVLLPLIDALRKEPDVFVRVLVAPKVIASSPRVLRALIDRSIVPFALDAESTLLGENRILRNLDALLTASETSLNVHRIGHALTKSANALGIATYTLQHGLENVGLTYFDDAQDETVHFASKTVLIWGDPADLPTQVPDTTRNKCRTVGRTRSIQTVPPPLPSSLLDGRRVVSVFENLHWHRYTEAYHEAFRRDLMHLCELRPDLIILLKPHHAGRHLSRNMSLITPMPANLILADPQDPAWEPFTAPALIPASFCVITTPSTVALDAAEAIRPVAVLRYDLNLPAYAGLPMLSSASDWLQFVDECARAPEPLLGAAATFRERSRARGDAIPRIVEHLRGEDRSTI